MSIQILSNNVLSTSNHKHKEVKLMNGDMNDPFFTKNGKKYAVAIVIATIGILGVCYLVTSSVPDWEGMCTDAIEDRGYDVVTISCFANSDGNSSTCTGVFRDSEYNSHMFTIDFKKSNGNWKTVNVKIY